MQIFQFSFGHKIYTVNKYINLITFVIFRGGPLGRICYAYLYECPAFTPPLRIVFVCISVAMTVINIVLFWRLCKSDMLKHKRKWENKKKTWSLCMLNHDFSKWNNYRGKLYVYSIKVITMLRYSVDLFDLFCYIFCFYGWLDIFFSTTTNMHFKFCLMISSLRITLVYATSIHIFLFLCYHALKRCNWLY